MKNKGFTLIELLVVVAIIGVLSTIVLGALGDARAKARDSRRLADIRTIQTALEVYYLDNDTYPVTSWASSHTSAWGTLESQLGVTLPKDPLNTSTSTSNSAATVSGNYVYTYFGHPDAGYCSGDAYMFVFQLEGKNGNGSRDGVVLCNNYNYNYGNSFVVGVDKDTNFKAPDTSGTLK